MELQVPSNTRLVTMLFSTCTKEEIAGQNGW